MFYDNFFTERKKINYLSLCYGELLQVAFCPVHLCCIFEVLVNGWRVLPSQLQVITESNCLFLGITVLLPLGTADQEASAPWIAWSIRVPSSWDHSHLDLFIPTWSQQIWMEKYKRHSTAPQHGGVSMGATAVPAALFRWLWTGRENKGGTWPAHFTALQWDVGLQERLCSVGKMKDC